MNGETSTPAAFIEASKDVLALRFVTSLQSEDVIVNNSEAFNDLSGIAFKVRSGEIWVFLAQLYFLSNATAGVEFTVTAPLGSSGRFGPISYNNSSSQTAFGTGVSLVTTADESAATMSGLVVAGADGIVQLQAAQNVATAFNTTFWQDSWIIAWRRDQ